MATELVEMIEEQMRSIEDEMVRLEEARGILAGDPPRRPTARALEWVRPDLVPAAERKLQELRMLDRLEWHAERGAQMQELMAEVGGLTPAQALRLIRRLEDAGKVYRTGAKRATRWFSSAAAPAA